MLWQWTWRPIDSSRNVTNLAIRLWLRRPRRLRWLSRNVLLVITHKSLLRNKERTDWQFLNNFVNKTCFKAFVDRPLDLLLHKQPFPVDSL